MKNDRAPAGPEGLAPRDQSVFGEPHLRVDAGLPARCPKCGYDRLGLEDAVCPECGTPPHDIEHSAWDEPALTGGAAVGGGEANPAAYAGWLALRRAATPRSTTWVVTALVALAAGPLGVIGAIWGGGQTLVSGIALVILGPVVEEVAKIMGATWVVEKRPYWFSSSAQVLICCGAGGLAFAAIENVLYLFVYFPKAGAGLWVWRWTVCVALHTGCSLIAGLGLARVWRRTMAAGTPPDLSVGGRYLITAIVVHGVYNAGALLLAVGGIMGT